MFKTIFAAALLIGSLGSAYAAEDFTNQKEAKVVQDLNPEVSMMKVLFLI